MTAIKTKNRGEIDDNLRKKTWIYQMVGNDVIARVAVFDDVESNKQLPGGTGAGHLANRLVVPIENFTLDGADDALSVLPLRPVRQLVTFGPFHDQFVGEFVLLLLDVGLNLTVVTELVEALDGERP